MIAFSQPLMMARGVIHAERATKWPPPLGKVTSGGALGAFRGSPRVRGTLCTRGGGKYSKREETSLQASRDGSHRYKTLNTSPARGMPRTGSSARVCASARRARAADTSHPVACGRAQPPGRSFSPFAPPPEISASYSAATGSPRPEAVRLVRRLGRHQRRARRLVVLPRHLRRQPSQLALRAVYHLHPSSRVRLRPHAGDERVHHGPS